MTPIKFKGYNIVFGENQPEYLPLPAHLDIEEGLVVTCWEMTEEERNLFLNSGKVYLQQFTYNQPLQPILPSISNPFDLLES